MSARTTISSARADRVGLGAARNVFAGVVLIATTLAAAAAATLRVTFMEAP